MLSGLGRVMHEFRKEKHSDKIQSEREEGKGGCMSCSSIRQANIDVAFNISSPLCVSKHHLV